MDPRTGELYTPGQVSRMTPERRAELVEITGTPDQVAVVAAAVARQSRQRDRKVKRRRVTVRASRRVNRGRR